MGWWGIAWTLSRCALNASAGIAKRKQLNSDSQHDLNVLVGLKMAHQKGPKSHSEIIDFEKSKSI